MGIICIDGVDNPTWFEGDGTSVPGMFFIWIFSFLFLQLYSFKNQEVTSHNYTPLGKASKVHTEAVSGSIRGDQQNNLLWLYIVVGMVGLYNGLYSEIIDCLWRWACGLVGVWWRPIGQNIRQGEREVSN